MIRVEVVDLCKKISVVMSRRCISLYESLWLMEDTLNVEHGDHSVLMMTPLTFLGRYSFRLLWHFGSYMAAHYNCHFPSFYKPSSSS